MTEETRQILRRWLWADYMLYDHFKVKLAETLGGYDNSTITLRLPNSMIGSNILMSDMAIV